MTASKPSAPKTAAPDASASSDAGARGGIRAATAAAAPPAGRTAAPAGRSAIAAEYRAALAHQAAGRDAEALRLYASLIDRNPDLAEVHFQVARLFLRADRPERALRHARAAARLKPEVGDVWRVLAEVVATLSDSEETARLARDLAAAPIDRRLAGDLSAATAFRTPAAPSPAPATPAEVASLAAALAGGDAALAGRRAAALATRHPGSAAAHHLQALALSAQGRPAEAATAARAGLDRCPSVPALHLALAAALQALGQAAEAERHANAALRLGPGDADALHLRGRCRAEQGRLGDAAADHRRALAVDPGHAGAAVALARHLIDEDKDALAAEAVLRKAMARGADGPALRHTLAMTLAELGRTDAALAEYDRLERLEPGSVRGLVGRAELNQTLGRFDAAEADFRAAIARAPDRGETYRVFLSTKTIAPDDPLVAQMDRRFRDETLPGETRASFGFALAKVMEEAGADDRVFDYLHPANRLLSAARPYDPALRRGLAETLIARFRAVDWSDPAMLSDCAFAPIFVTGLPRSGTTLVEQVIAAHPAVTGTGEIGLAPRLALRLMGGDGAAIRDAARLPAEEFAALGRTYAAHMARHFPGADRPTDKSIQTWQFIGVLKRALPRARIVVVRRDPRDNLLSMYKNVFPDGGHRYAYDLGHLADQFHQFDATVAMWAELVPDWFHVVRYEELVADPEAQSRRLIAACGLDWHPACLDFHRSDRRVKTLSLYQVRQPMYRSSTRSWERYGDALDELMTALGPRWADAE